MDDFSGNIKINAGIGNVLLLRWGDRFTGLHYDVISYIYSYIEKQGENNEIKPVMFIKQKGFSQYLRTF